MENINGKDDFDKPKNLQFMMLSNRQRILEGLFDALDFYYSNENFFVKKKETYSYQDFKGSKIARGERKGTRRIGLG